MYCGRDGNMTRLVNSNERIEELENTAY